MLGNAVIIPHWFLQLNIFCTPAATFAASIRMFTQRMGQ